MTGSRTVLALDFGRRRIGAAVGQEVSRTAQPLATISVRKRGPDWDTLARIVQEWQPDLFVLGMPTTADGAAHPLENAIARFARRLNGRYGRPVAFVDERLSSYAAANDPDAERFGTDATAARLILETWFVENAAAATS